MKTALYALAALFLTTSLHAQKSFDVKIVSDSRSDFGLGYNFFIGDQSEDFSTSIKGFGSGFLFDVFSGRMSTDILWMGTESVHLTVGAGAAIMKYRFSNPLIFTTENNNYGYTFDTDPAHSYGNGFFSNDKSKLVVASFIFPVNLNFDLGKFYFSAGGLFDVFLTGKHKLKYTEDGDRKKEMIRHDDFKNFPINKTKWGVGAMLMHKESGINAGFTYMLTPFFKETSAFPELREMRISFGYDLSIFDQHKRNRR